MTSLSRVIYAGFRALGIEDETVQRSIYEQTTRKSRLRDMTVAEQQAVADDLRRRGFVTTPRKHKGQPDMSGRYSSKVRALWIALYNLGVVKDRRDSAILAFVKGQTSIEAMRFVHHHEDASAIIEALKAIAARAGVNWSYKGRAEHELAFGCQIARAQWKILHPDAGLEFWLGINQMLGRPGQAREVSKEEWIAIMNELGSRIWLSKARAQPLDKVELHRAR